MTANTTTAAEFITALTARLEDRRKADRSAWNRGVALYADELTEELTEALRDGYVTVDQLTSTAEIKRALLNGASDWTAYSWGGSSLIYDGDIAERLCTPSELKKTRGGERRPNSREEWLDTQARALNQAARRIITAASAVLLTAVKADVAA